MSNAKAVPKSVEAWAEFAASLPAKVRNALEAKDAPQASVPLGGPDEEEGVAEYAEFLKSLPATVQAALTKQADPSDLPKAKKAADDVYGVVESPDGEWPQMRVFKTPEGLARRLAALQDKDVTALCFRGQPAQITKGPQRYLVFADFAVRIPLYEEGPAQIVPREVVDGLDVEELGFLGPPELAGGDEEEYDGPTSPADEIAGEV